MQKHRLRLEYRGRLAPTGYLDAADPPDITMGAKRLMATQAHFYTQGYVPRNTDPNSRHFCIRGGSPGRDNWGYDLIIEISASEVFDVSKYSFKDHFVPIVRAWRDGKPFEIPEFTKTQPVLNIPSRQNNAICDSEPPLKAQLVRLSGRTSQAMDMITRPIGQSASEFQMLFDDIVVMATNHRSREWELTEYERRLTGYGHPRAA